LTLQSMDWPSPRDTSMGLSPGPVRHGPVLQEACPFSIL
jgi:hypothetical protein